MMASSNIARLGIVLGVDTAELEVKISKAKETFHGFTKQVERDSNSAAKDIVALRYATEDYGKTLTKVEQVEREIKAGRYQRAEGSLIEMLRKEAAAYDAKANAMKNMAGAQFKMNEQQKLNLTYQTTDFFTQIASGQSPFIAALQQGGQLKDTMGGLGNMFKAIGSLFTPFSVGLGSVAAAVGGVGYAFYKAKEDLEEFKSAMTLTGGFAGVTYTGLLNLGNVLSEKTNVAIGDARDLMQQLAATGKYTHTSMQAVGEVILRFSKLAGVDAAKAAETLIPLLDGTASSAKQLNDKYHFLTLEQYKNIKALEKQGQLQESIRLQSTLLNQSFQTSRRELGYFEEGWKLLGKAASGAWDAMMGWGRDDKGQDLQKLNKEIALATAAMNAPTNRMTQAKDENQAKLDALLEQRKLLLKSMLLEDEAAKARAKAAAKNADDIRKEDKYGPMGIAKAEELAKSKAEIEFSIAKQNTHELIQLDLEMKNQLSTANREMLEKNQKEDNQFVSQNLEIYKNKAIAIAIETAKKQSEIKTKYALLDFAESQKIEDEKSAANVARSKANEAIRTASQAQTRELELQRESLELKYQMIYATETEQKLAQISLEYARKRKEAENSPERDYEMGQLERQEELAKMFVVMQESAKLTQQVFDSVFGNLSSAIDNFVKTGKLSMKDLARSVIQDLIAIQMKAAAMKFLGAAFGAFTGGGFGTGNAFGNQDLGGFLAEGGPADANTPYVVGERGPELFIPRSSGTVIPNNQISNIGSTTNVTNNYINAIDTKSFEDRLLGSSNAVWAANQYAGKNMPTNFGRT
jgi:lambda family phage tail tape measure protein